MSMFALPDSLAQLSVDSPDGGRSGVVEFRLWEGEVASVQAHTSTEVAGSGGGGSIGTMYGHVTGRIDPISIHSESTHHQSVFIGSAAGERVVKLQNSGMSFRPGNAAAAIFACAKGDEEAELFAVVNRDQDSMETYPDNLDPALRRLVGFKPAGFQSFGQMLWGPVLGRIGTGFIAAFVAMLPIDMLPRGVDDLFGVAVLLVCLGWTVQRVIRGVARFRRRRRFLAALRQEILQRIVEINRSRAEALGKPIAEAVAAE